MSKQKLIASTTPPLVTDIFNYKSKELYINLDPKKDIPPKGHPERGDFISWEKKKCREGVNIGGVKITGRLYYHLNYHWMLLDRMVNGEEKRVESKPELRDNEWEIFNAYEEAILSKNAFTVAGSRQLGKSEILCSLTTYNTNIIENSEGLLLFSNKADKETFVKKIRVALKYGEPFIYIPNIDQDWKKTEIRFGYTETDNVPSVYSTLYMYNTNAGNASEISAGKSPTFFAYDEIAKEECLSSINTVIPGLRGKFGLRTSPYYCFTGGNVEKSKDAEDMFLHPEAYNIKPFSFEGKNTGYFMPGLYRQDCKKEILFTDYLKEKEIPFQKNAELSKLTIQVKDAVKAEEVISKEILNASLSDNPSEASKIRIYYPRSIKEMFLKAAKSDFKKEHIQQQRAYLSENLEVTYVDFFRDIHSKSVYHKLSDKVPIKSYPKEKWHDGDTPVAIYDFPKYKGFGVHVIGFDPIRENESSNSNSLASIHVWRRNHNDMSDLFRDKMVASWAGRFKQVKEVHELVLMLAEFYDAKILYEHSDRAFLDFMEGKNKSHWLIDTVPIQREINPKSKVATTKGIVATPRNKAVLYASTLGLVNEELEDGTSGYAKILDDVLLQELEVYDEDLNLDRYISLSLVAQARLYYDKFGVPIVQEIQEVPNLLDQLKKKPNYKNPLGYVAPKIRKGAKTIYGF